MAALKEQEFPCDIHLRLKGSVGDVEKVSKGKFETSINKDFPHVKSELN